MDCPQTTSQVRMRRANFSYFASWKDQPKLKKTGWMWPDDRYYYYLDEVILPLYLWFALSASCDRIAKVAQFCRSVAEIGIHVLCMLVLIRWAVVQRML